MRFFVVAQSFECGVTEKTAKEHLLVRHGPHCFEKPELKTAKHCAVSQEELSRLWPGGNHRETKIARFAEDNGFRLSFYRDSLCAIKERHERD
jgi:hypothetical protein